MSQNKKKLFKIFVLLIIIIFVLTTINISIPLIKTVNNPDLFRDYIESFGIYSPIIYVFLNIVQIIIPLIPGEPMEIMAGYAFGIIKGSILCFLAESIGSIIVILMVKKFGRKLVLFFFEKNKLDSLKFLQNEKKSESLITILFLMPGIPKDLLCYVVGLTNIDFSLLLVITTLCRIPSIITSTLIGGGLGNKSYIFTIVVFVITALLSISGILLFNKVKEKHNQRKLEQ